jgi:hypothetical protein
LAELLKSPMNVEWGTGMQLHVDRERKVFLFSHDFALSLVTREISSPANRPKWNAFVGISYKKAFTCIPGWYWDYNWRLFCYLTIEYLSKKLFVAEPCVVWFLRITTTFFIDYDTRSSSNPVLSEYRLGALNTGNVLVLWR